MSNEQSAAIRSTSSTKQHKLICQLRINTRPLALDRQATTATASGTTATTKHTAYIYFSKESSGGKKKTKQCDTGTNACHHWFLPWILSTYYHFAWRTLATGGGTCKIQPSRPRGCSHSQCCCVAFSGAVIVVTTTSSSFSHACARHVYIHVCMHVYLPTFNKQMDYYDPYRSTMGILYRNIIHLFWDQI